MNFVLLVAGFSRWGNRFKKQTKTKLIHRYTGIRGIIAMHLCSVSFSCKSRQHLPPHTIPGLILTCVFPTKTRSNPDTHSGHNLSPGQGFLQLQVMPRGATCLRVQVCHWQDSNHSGLGHRLKCWLSDKLKKMMQIFRKISHFSVHKRIGRVDVERGVGT